MAKKIVKFLAFTAIVGTAIIGGIAIFNKFRSQEDDFDDDFMDFDDDDFDEDIADSSENEREYVSIPLENEKEETNADVKKG